MKTQSHFILTLTIFTQSLFAANPNCATKAGEAAFKLARPQGNTANSSLFVSVGETKLLRRLGSTLFYSVEINYDINDGYSDNFPSEVYSVIAVGNENVCKVTAVKLAK